jgi:hypothetical protein
LARLKEDISVNFKEGPTYEEANRVLKYDPLTGILTWKITIPKGGYAVKGKEAGGLNKENGYRFVSVGGTQYRAHRVAWLLYHGYLPENGLDHKDRIRHHNWISNLREASQQCNMRNASKRSDNITGVTGVTWDKANNKWMAYINLDGKAKKLGRHLSFQDAVQARWEAEVKFNFPNCNTTSTAYEWLKLNSNKT